MVRDSDLAVVIQLGPSCRPHCDLKTNYRPSFAVDVFDHATVLSCNVISVNKNRYEAEFVLSSEGFSNFSSETSKPDVISTMNHTRGFRCIGVNKVVNE